jgi:predicted nucleic acid-binding protein
VETFRPPVIVADASLLVNLWAGGPGARLAELVLRRDPSWVAPTLWRSEFRNAVTRMARAHHITLDHALAATQAAEDHMREREYGVVSQQVLRLAEQSRRSAYDCEYVALAEDLDIPLVTFDHTLIRAFSRLALAPETFLRD